MAQNLLRGIPAAKRSAALFGALGRRAGLSSLAAEPQECLLFSSASRRRYWAQLIGLSVSVGAAGAGIYAVEQSLGNRGRGFIPAALTLALADSNQCDAMDTGDEEAQGHFEKSTSVMNSGFSSTGHAAASQAPSLPLSVEEGILPRLAKVLRPTGMDHV